MYLILAIILGLLISYFTGGFNFSTGICFFAAIVLIYPILLKLNFQDFKLFLKNKKIILLDLFINFILLPILAFLIAYLFFAQDSIYFIFALILLAILPGGGLLLSWIHNSKADEKVGFLLLAFNLFIFSLAYILFNFSLDYFKSNKDITPKTEISKKLSLNDSLVNNRKLFLNNPFNKKEETKGCVIQKITKNTGLDCFSSKSPYIYGIYAFFVLILLPLVLSILTKLLNLQNKIIKIIPYLTKMGSFLLILYIFSLSEIKNLFYYHNFIFLIKLFLSVFTFYISSLFLIKGLLRFINLDIAVKKSIFWNGYIRFITLGFILSMLYVYTFSAPVEIIFIFIFAYFIQIITASLYIRLFN